MQYEEKTRAVVNTTRPNDTTAYSVGDVVGGVIQFADIGPARASLLIVAATLQIDVTAVPAGMTSFDLHFYSATPPSDIADNAAFDLSGGDRDVYLGSISGLAPTDVGSTLFAELDQLGKPVTLSDGSLYAYLVTAGGYTPAAQAVYRTGLWSVPL